MRSNPELLYRWVSRGCLVQVTAQSYLGSFGQQAQRLVDRWLDRNLINFFASDAHDTNHRPPLLSPCYQKLAETRGREVADLMLKQNPQAVIRGLPLPAGPKPVGPKEKKQRGRSWRSFFLRR
jgi:protein-tyrosine phosphatase